MTGCDLCRASWGSDDVASNGNHFVPQIPSEGKFVAQ